MPVNEGNEGNFLDALANLNAEAEVLAPILDDNPGEDMPEPNDGPAIYAEAGGEAPAPVVGGYVDVAGNPIKFGAKKMGLGQHKMKYADKYVNTSKSNFIDDDEESSKITGLLVVYINVGTLAYGQSLDLIDKVKDQYKTIERDLIAGGIRIMWLPVRTGDTHVEYLKF